MRPLGVADPSDATAIIAACERVAVGALELPIHLVEVASSPSRARPAARGRYLAGTVTLFPAAFADPLTLAWTVLHELAHAAGQDESGAEAFAARFLTKGEACSSSL